MYQEEAGGGWGAELAEWSKYYYYKYYLEYWNLNSFIHLI
jgi:hypothetical protein